MGEPDIYFVQVDDTRWHVLSRRHAALGPIGWVRQRQVFEGGPIGSPRAKRLWLSLEASRDWFAAQLQSPSGRNAANG
ncbi:hypothetical protein N1027_06695 [Herbiconiux sp. CPCC 205763]|uniref:Uncharacterized protein n=1 Tax=Herbiconiux aconitum TaxID=2970913 RepID=A0ABT2GNM9_9MICO|nr:hypothetical protein [Herbiconiux aconitum]MCS5717821.1 hypothetical protein [Herbiconiux aconitum]